MSSGLHSSLSGLEIHTPYRQVFANAAARTGDATVYTIVDLYKVALQVDTGQEYYLSSYSPTVWTALAIGSGEANTASNVGTGQGVFKTKSGIDLQFRSLVAGSNITLVSGTNDVTVSSTGEANTGSNLGTGHGVFKVKSGVDLQYRTLVAGTNITLTSGTNDITISSAAGAGEANTASNVGTGHGVFKTKSGVDLQFRSLLAGSNITLTSGTNDVTVASTGEANTASNVGAGHGVFKTKSGTDLQFRSVVAGTNVTVTSGTNDITITVPSIGETNTASNIGTGHGVFKTKNSTDLQFRSLVAGTNIALVSGTNDITISSTASGGETNTASNVGTGQGIFKTKSGVDLQFRSLTAGSNITLTSGTNDVTIASTGEANTASNVGTGGQVFKAKTGADLAFRSLLGGPNVTVSQNTNDLTITVSGTGGEANTGSNVGTGHGVFKAKSGSDLQFRSLTAGTNVTLTSGTNDITISASSGSSYDPRDLLAFDHFIAGSITTERIGALGWLSAVNGTGADIAITGEAGHPGVVDCGAGTAAAARTGVYIGDTIFLNLFLGSTQNEINNEWLVKFNSNALSATNNERFIIGFSDGFAAGNGIESTNGIYAELNPSLSANWRFVTSAASTRTRTDCGVAPSASTWYRINIRITYPGGVPTAVFSINGTDLATNTTNFPTAGLGIGARMDANVTANEGRFQLDYMLLTQITDKET